MSSRPKSVTGVAPRTATDRVVRSRVWHAGGLNCAGVLPRSEKEPEYKKSRVKKSPAAERWNRNETFQPNQVERPPGNEMVVDPSNPERVPVHT